MKTNGTVKMLVLSAVSVVLCLVMLLGATFAWFTSSVTSADNIVKTAGFNVTLKWSTDCSTWKSISGEMFSDNENALQPGDYTKIVYIKVTNENPYDVKATVQLCKPTVTQGEDETVSSPLVLCYKRYGVDELTDPQEVTDPTTLTQSGTTFNALVDLLDHVTLAKKSDANTDETIVAIAFTLPSDYQLPTNAESVESIVTQFNIIVTGEQSHS